MKKKITAIAVRALLCLKKGKAEGLKLKVESLKPYQAGGRSMLPLFRKRAKGEVKAVYLLSALSLAEIRYEWLLRKRALQAMVMVFMMGGGVYAQAVKPLKIGDRVPPGFWATKMQVMANGKVQEQTLAGYKGKAIILDFWGIYCMPCIKAFPKLGAWQQEFASGLQIIGVSRESKAKLDEFFVKREPLRFPTVVADHYLNEMFEHSFIPHEVWINAQGLVAGFTSADAMNAESIRQFIATGNLNTEMKIDEDLSKPLFASVQLPVHRLLNYSVLLKGHLEGTGASFAKIDLDEAYGITLTNQPLVSLLKRVGGKLIAGFNPKLLLISKADSLELFVGQRKGQEKTDWYHEHEFSMSVVLSKRDTALLGKRMLELLQGQSGYEIDIERRRMDCLVLTVQSGYMMPLRQARMENNLERASGKGLRNGRIGDLVAWLNAKPNGLPMVVDETGLKQGVDLDVTGYNEAGLQEDLARQGFELQRRERELTVMVLKKK